MTAPADPGYPHDYGRYCECLTCGGPVDLCRVCGAVDLFDDEADDLCVACAIAARQEMTDLQEWQRDMGAR